MVRPLPNGIRVQRLVYDDAQRGRSSRRLPRSNVSVPPDRGYAMRADADRDHFADPFGRNAVAIAVKADQAGRRHALALLDKTVKSLSQWHQRRPFLGPDIRNRAGQNAMRDLAPQLHALRTPPAGGRLPRERSLRSLYCCCDGVPSRGAAVTNCRILQPCELLPVSWTPS